MTVSPEYWVFSNMHVKTHVKIVPAGLTDGFIWLETYLQIVSYFIFLRLCLVIHRLMPALLKTLKSKKELVSNEIYLLSAVTALLKVAETLPHFLSPYLLECLLQVSYVTPPGV